MPCSGCIAAPLTADQVGGVFEQWFILQVHALRQLARQGWELWSYRTEGGAEVDLVVDTMQRQRPEGTQPGNGNHRAWVVPGCVGRIAALGFALSGLGA